MKSEIGVIDQKSKMTSKRNTHVIMPKLNISQTNLEAPYKETNITSI